MLSPTTLTAAPSAYDPYDVLLSTVNTQVRQELAARAALRKPSRVPVRAKVKPVTLVPGARARLPTESDEDDDDDDDEHEEEESDADDLDWEHDD
ncbi:hypothetical protein HK104_009702, partial [Borealophlyctis nickersoniae]